MPEQACRVDRLYHYFLNGEVDVAAIRSGGLLPLSARAESARWQQIEAARPGLYRDFYARYFEPVLRLPCRNSGNFVTPIDFRLLPGLPPARLARVALPLSAIKQG